MLSELLGACQESLDAAEAKIAKIDARQERSASPVFLGLPTFDSIAAATVTVR
ncbi:hypothetical protein P3T27_002635 [Kitasatospora sp. MAA19]|uniref:hypothetical protein n=1 Tax=Kitasatospora sp. MAA19 TaxID=3035090 RepID=UPI002474EBDB|nr:hypothetical protein [Kitasatospora sp. MAA19]MDH6705913.1 hypothetical protein [Kitasatospora sp. MAA19]